MVRTAGVLWTDTSLGHRRTSAFEPLIDARAAALMNEVRAAYQLQAMQRNLPSPEPIVTADEREAANLVIETVGATTPAGPGGGGAGAGGQRASAAITSAGGGRPGDAAGPSLPDEFNAELTLLLRRNITVLQLRDFLSGEFTPLPLADVMAVLRNRESRGHISLVAKAKAGR